MKLDNIKAVFFDAADTLFYIKDGLGKTYANPAFNYGANPLPSEIKRSFSKYFHSAPPLAFNNVSFEKREILEKQWWYEIVRKVYEEVGMFDDFDKYFDELFEIFRSDAWELFSETEHVLTEIKNRDYKLVTVTNFDSRVYDVSESLGILQYFDDVVISSEAGYAKPDPRIFQIALDRNKLESAQCVHIGDNFQNDYECPKILGINSIFLDREDKIKDKKINKIGNLKEILTLLN